ncbi:hypothetical protein Hdeb2414_s0017g00511161 [Helianthus debilis subsp. tardiflorus]
MAPPSLSFLTPAKHSFPSLPLLQAPVTGSKKRPQIQPVFRLHPHRPVIGDGSSRLTGDHVTAAPPLSNNKTNPHHHHCSVVVRRLQSERRETQEERERDGERERRRQSSTAAHGSGRGGDDGFRQVSGGSGR